MTIRNYDYNYSGQMRRFLEQLVNAFSGFHYQPGARNGVAQAPRMVPCRMAQTSRMVANILRNASDNTLQAVPMITIAQSGLSGRRDAVQNPNHVDRVQVTERDIVNGRYGTKAGNKYTVERIMPVPMEMQIQVDIWTSNLQQKHELIEQILPIIYPSFDIQNSENPLDWTSIATCYTEDVTWSSRAISVGTADEIDISTITLKLPMWITPPVKVKRQTLIKEIVTNVDDASTTDDQFVAGALLAQEITTPGNYHVYVDGDSIMLKNSKNGDLDASGNPLVWSDVLAIYGTLRPTVSRIMLHTTNDPEGPFVAGTLQYDAGRSNYLIWQIDPDTLPSNTLGSIIALIDPVTTFPGGIIPAAQEGDRYMILNDIGPSQAWPSLTAHANDIVQYHLGHWIVSFNSRAIRTVNLVLNNYTGRQLRWTGSEWTMSIGGTYGQGMWRLVL